MIHRCDRCGATRDVSPGRTPGRCASRASNAAGCGGAMLPPFTLRCTACDRTEVRHTVPSDPSTVLACTCGGRLASVPTTEELSPMNRVINIYGSSDDLIQIDGTAISEEVDVAEVGEALVSVSDGTAFRIAYGEEGIWHIDVLAAGPAVVEHHRGTDEDTDYSDVLRLAGDLRWVHIGEKYIPIR